MLYLSWQEHKREFDDDLNCQRTLMKMSAMGIHVCAKAIMGQLIRAREYAKEK